MTIPGLEPLARGRRRPRVTGVAILYVVRLRRRWLAELMAVLAVAAGVALAYVAAVAATSPAGSVRALSDSIVGRSQLQLIARGGTRVPQPLHDQIVALPGVRWVAPVLQVPGNVIGRRGEQEATFFGADPRTITLSGSLLDGFTGTEAAQQEAVVLPVPTARAAGIRFGDDARVQVAGRTITLPVIVAGREQIGALVDMPAVLVPLRYLQRLARSGPEMSRMLIATEPGRVAEVQAAVRRLAQPRADVFPADRESHLFAAASRPLDRATTAFAVLAVLAGGVLAACALLVTAGDRRRMAAQQWTQGVGRGTRVATLLVDAAAVGVAGTLLGLGPGEVLSRSGTFSDASILSGAFPVGDGRVVAAGSVAVAGAAGLVAVAIGVFAPLGRRWRPRRRSGRLRAGPGAAPSRRRALAGGGLAALGGAVVVLLVVPQAMVAGLVLLALSLVLMAGPAVTASVGALDAASRRLGQPSNAVVLAVQHLSALRRQPGAPAVALTAAIAVFGATALAGGERDLQAGLDRVTGVGGAADVWLAPTGAGSAMATTSFAPGAADAIARLPEVAGMAPYRSAFLDVAGRRAWVIGQPAGVVPVPAVEVVEGDAATLAERIRAGGWATLSTDLAGALGVRVGETVVLPAPRPVRVRVAATTTNLGWASGAIVLGADDYRRAWASDAVSAYRVTLAAGVTPSAGRDAIARALGRDGSWLRAQTAARRAERQHAVARAGPARLRQVARIALLAGLLALGATVTAVLWQHRAHVAHLRADGPTRGQIWHALVVEIGVVLGAGAALGALYGLVGQLVVAEGLRAVTSFPVVVVARPGIAAASAGAAIAAGLVVAAAVAWGLVALTRPMWRR